MAVPDRWWKRIKRSPATPETKVSVRGIGEQGERLAQEYLAQRQLVLVERNYRCAFGEIDLIMRDRDCLVFVEVKQRKNALYGSPLEMISAKKQQKLRRTAEHYISHHKISSHQAMRFDAVGITTGGATESVQWVQNAF